MSTAIPVIDNLPEKKHSSAASDASATVLKIAVMAVGGQGGGVLSNWISDLATLGGYTVQMTSVAGVAQRTGATIYYIEMAPKTDRSPVFSLTPSPGDVDIVIAAELMEAGRAVVRNFVTVDRTTLIASTHRILAVDEKQVPADGRADSLLVVDEIAASAYKTLCFDMQAIAKEHGSMISASLFGALAKSQATGFGPELFEEVIRRSGRGVDASLATFKAALHYEPSTNEQAEGRTAEVAVHGSPNLLSQWQQLESQLQSYPPAALTMVTAGLRQVVDYQDITYGQEYLDRVERFVQHDSKDDSKLTQAAAKSICNAMCYDDLIRVADLKTRSSRESRLRSEQQIDADQIVHVTEYFHPRAAEVCSTLPAAVGGWIERHPRAFKLLDRLVNRGRRVRTDSLIGFGMLWLVSAMKPFRRKLLRHRVEQKHIENLIQTSLNAMSNSSELAIEVLRCQRLIKGYSDTHSRGQSKYKKVLSAVTVLEARSDAAERLRELTDSALKEESADELDNALAAI